MDKKIALIGPTRQRCIEWLRDNNIDYPGDYIIVSRKDHVLGVGWGGIKLLDNWQLVKNAHPLVRDIRLRLSRKTKKNMIINTMS